MRDCEFGMNVVQDLGDGVGVVESEGRFLKKRGVDCFVALFFLCMDFLCFGSMFRRGLKWSL